MTTHSQRYYVYTLTKASGTSKIDTKTSDHKSVYMVVQDCKESKVQGYVYDTILQRVTEAF